jgi:two-component system sensor histidine kinase MtrB
MRRRSWWSGLPAATGVQTQVSVMFAVGALALSVLLGVSTALLVHPVMVQQRQRTTDRQATINARIVQEVLVDSPTAVDATLRSLDRPIASYSLVSVDGRWYASRVTADPMDLPPRVRRAAVHHEAYTARVELATGPSLVAVRPLAGVGAVYVEVFTLTDINETMQVLVIVLAAVGTLTTVLGVALGRWAARAALRPVTVLTRAAAAVAAGDLTTTVAPGRAKDLRTLADAFNRTVTALRRRVDSDIRFAADVSHELRTPLMTIINAVELLRVRRATLPPGDREVLDLLTEEVGRFHRTVTALLEISTASGTSFVGEPVSVAELARMADTAARRPVAEIVGEGGTVTGDPRRLERVLVNLVDNAERHGGGVIRVTVHRRPGMVRLHVDDAGPGVPADRREQIFERFSRLEPGRTAGTGLGLALVAEEVRRHAGRVWVEDRPGGGARFVVELPTDPAAARALPRA